MIEDSEKWCEWKEGADRCALKNINVRTQEKFRGRNISPNIDRVIILSQAHMYQITDQSIIFR